MWSLRNIAHSLWIVHSLWMHTVFECRLYYLRSNSYQKNEKWIHYVPGLRPRPSELGTHWKSNKLKSDLDHARLSGYQVARIGYMMGLDSGLARLSWASIMGTKYIKLIYLDSGLARLSWVNFYEASHGEAWYAWTQASHVWAGQVINTTNVQIWWTATKIFEIFFKYMKYMKFI